MTSSPDGLLQRLRVVDHVVSIGVQLMGVNTIRNNSSSSMLPKVMSAAVQVLSLNGQYVVSIQVCSHLQCRQLGTKLDDDSTMHALLRQEAGKVNVQGTVAAKFQNMPDSDSF